MTIYRHLLKLDPTNKETRRIISDANLLHKTVMEGFHHHLPHRDFFADSIKPHPTNRSDHNILHAIDHRSDGTIWILVQANLTGNWENSKISPALIEDVLPVKYTPPATGKIFYQIIASPTKDKHGKRYPLLRPEEIKHWWNRKAKANGLNLTGTRINIHEKHQLHLNYKSLKLVARRISGKAEIINTEQFLTACSTGIGRGKAYGCGLLLTLPAH